MRNQVEIRWLQQIYHRQEAGTTITNLNSDISGFCNNSFTQGLNKNSAVKKQNQILPLQRQPCQSTQIETNISPLFYVNCRW